MTDYMELKQFIKGVVFDITNAIAECQKDLNNGSIISPTNVSNASNNKISTKEGDFSVSCIDFEVAVTAGNTTESGSNIGGGIQVWGVSLGGNNKEDSRQINESISKIKFSIPVVYPRTRVEKKANLSGFR